MLNVSVNASLDKLPKGYDFCVFVPGAELFETAATNSPIEVLDPDGEAVEGVIRKAFLERLGTALSTHAGASYTIAGTRPINQGPMGMMPGTQSGADITAIVNDIKVVNGDALGLTDVLKLYTIIYVQLPAPAPAPMNLAGTLAGV